LGSTLTLVVLRPGSSGVKGHKALYVPGPVEIE